MNVAVAVITDDENRILITRRPTHKPHAGLWEFPGGKLEAEEPPSVALIREIKEEVGLNVLKYDYLGYISHSYSDKKVCLFVFHVSQFSGEPYCCEEQIDLRWVPFESMQTFEFPAANEAVMKLIKNNLLQLANC